MTGDYDGEQFDPPAPMALVSLRNPKTGQSIGGILMLLDTGADMSAVPLQAVLSLGMTAERAVGIRVSGFDGGTVDAQEVDVDLRAFGGTARGRFLVVPQAYGIIGRDVLNLIELVLDGTHLRWSAKPASA